MVTHQRANGFGDQRRDLHGPMPFRVHVPSRVKRWGQERNRGGTTGITHPNAGTLVVEVESEFWHDGVADGFQGSAFRCDQPPGVPINVDALGVPPLEVLGAVGVKHRDEVKGRVLGQALGQGMVRPLGQEPDDVHEGHRGGAFVPVHLGPEENRSRPAAIGELIQGPPLDALAHFSAPDIAAEKGLHDGPILLVVEPAVV